MTLTAPIQATLTILETDPAPPTVSPKVQLVFAAHTRRVIAFQLSFSQPMDAASAQNVANYQVLLPPAHKNGPKRSVPLSRAVLDQSGTIVTLYRADLGRQHLTKLVQILVRGMPAHGPARARMDHSWPEPTDREAPTRSPRLGLTESSRRVRPYGRGRGLRLSCNHPSGGARPSRPWS